MSDAHTQTHLQGATQETSLSLLLSFHPSLRLSSFLSPSIPKTVYNNVFLCRFVYATRKCGRNDMYESTSTVYFVVSISVTHLYSEPARPKLFIIIALCAVSSNYNKHNNNYNLSERIMISHQHRHTGSLSDDDDTDFDHIDGQCV